MNKGQSTSLPETVLNTLVSLGNSWVPARPPALEPAYLANLTRLLRLQREPIVGAGVGPHGNPNRTRTEAVRTPPLWDQAKEAESAGMTGARGLGAAHGLIHPSLHSLITFPSISISCMYLHPGPHPRRARKKGSKRRASPGRWVVG